MTVGDLITASLRRINVLQEGEVPSADTMADCLLRTQDFVDAMAAERLTIYSIVRTTWTLVSGTASYTVGTGGTVNIVRPVYIDDVRYQDTSITPTIEYRLTPLTDDAYEAIPQKTLTSPYPTSYYYNPTYPTGTLTFWLVPTSSTLQGVIYAPTAVTQFTATTDTVALPPGYARFLRDNLALEFWPEFRENVPVDPLLRQSASESKAAIKRANTRLSDLSVDAAVLPRRPGRYSIFSDGPA